MNSSSDNSWSTFSPTLALELDPRGPRHAALERALRAAIRSGRLAAGTRLPSTRALAGDLGLARGTVVEAYAQLQAEGYLDARHGSRTWVAGVAALAHSAPEHAPVATREPRYSFHPGLPDLTAFPRAAWVAAQRRALRDIPASALAYGDPRGRAELRVALADYVARARGVVADPELLVVCAGFRHGLSLVVRALAARGARSVAMEDPCLERHRDVAAAAGLRTDPIAVDDAGARTEQLPLTRAGAAVLAPAHQYPRGVVLQPERRADAIAWARETGGLVIEDDYDAELRYDRQPVGALQALDPEHVAYGGTTSKTLAPGLRLGWLVVPPALLEPVTALRETEDAHVAVTEQLAFAELLRSGAYERHIRRMRACYRRRRDRLVTVLADRAPRIATVGASAGLRVLLELPPGGPASDELVAEGSRRSLELFPVGPSHHDGRPDRDGLVVGYGALPEHAFEPALAALGDLLAAAYRPSRGTKGRLSAPT